MADPDRRYQRHGRPRARGRAHQSRARWVRRYPEPPAPSQLPLDMLRQIALDADAPTLGNLCRTSRPLRAVCGDPAFWRDKFARDFPGARVELTQEMYFLLSDPGRLYWYLVDLGETRGAAALKELVGRLSKPVLLSVLKARRAYVERLLTAFREQDFLRMLGGLYRLQPQPPLLIEALVGDPEDTEDQLGYFAERVVDHSRRAYERYLRNSHMAFVLLPVAVAEWDWSERAGDRLVIDVPKGREGINVAAVIEAELYGPFELFWY